jgi:hypothetical protein
MSPMPDTTNTHPDTPLQYKRATVVVEVASVNTALLPKDVRTVVTTATKGTLSLRYTPRDQFRLTGKTSP